MYFVSYFKRFIHASIRQRSRFSSVSNPYAQSYKYNLLAFLLCLFINTSWFNFLSQRTFLVSHRWLLSGCGRISLFRQGRPTFITTHLRCQYSPPLLFDTSFSLLPEESLCVDFQLIALDGSINTFWLENAVEDYLFYQVFLDVQLLGLLFLHIKLS